MTSSPPRVVILGAGYAGALVARALEEDARAGRISVTVVERREAVHHKIGAIRASVRGGEWIERVRIPLCRVIRHGRTVVGDVVEVDPVGKVLKFREADQPPLHYDILICATGTQSHSPGDLPSHLRNKDDVRAYFRETAQVIREAREVVIVGGGASAVEYAGEIREAYPDKAITMFCSASHLLTSSVAPMTAKFLKQLYAGLEAKNIRLIRGEKVMKPEGCDLETRKFIRGPITVKTVGEQSLTLTTDLLLWAASWSINAGIYPEEWLNEMGELNIRGTFQLVERPEIFAVGDVSGLVETKQAITLPSKMKLIRNNVIKVADAMVRGTFEKGVVKGLKEYKVTDKVTMFLPLGSKSGVTQIGRSVYGDSKTSKSKGKDLYTDFFWKELTGAKAPNICDD